MDQPPCLPPAHMPGHMRNPAPAALPNPNPAPAAAAAAALFASFSATVGEMRLDVIPSGPERLDRMLALIAGARRSVRLLTYIFANDAAGAQVLAALCAAAARGVRVAVLVDSFGSAATADGFFMPLRAAGGQARWFGTRWTPQYLIRNHQKLLVVDEDVVMAGGFNIAAPYFAAAGDPAGWQDIGITITGPRTADMVAWFDQLAAWMDAPRPRFRDLRRAVAGWVPAAGPVQWLIGGPTPRLSPWARALRADIAAGRDMALSTAYFSPNTGVMRRIGRMARRGGNVSLVLPAHSDNAATIGASRLLYAYLLKRGAAVFEFEPARLHNKLIVIDSTVLIGSANLDMRSLYVNMELMLRVEDAAFADQCRALIRAQQAVSTPITPARHRQRATWINRLRWAAAWLIVGMVDYSVTRRLNFGLAGRD
ncbi:MAG: phospholipase D-like domain-containing protein [Sphingopyxis sp.]